MPSFLGTKVKESQVSMACTEASRVDSLVGGQ